jgi:hypothetical protein
MLNTSVGKTPFDRLVAITAERADGNCIFDPDPSGVTNTISFAVHMQGYANGSNYMRSFPYQQCVGGVGHDQTCDPADGCIFSKYAKRSFFQQQCAVLFPL